MVVQAPGDRLVSRGSSSKWSLLTGQMASVIDIRSRNGPETALVRGWVGTTGLFDYCRCKHGYVVIISEELALNINIQLKYIHICVRYVNFAFLLTITLDIHFCSKMYRKCEFNQKW